MKQTAVTAIAKAFRDWQKEWDLYKVVYNTPTPKTFEEFIEQFLQMEKEQIIDAHIEGQRVFDKHPHTQWTNDQSEQYYNETYGHNHTS